VPIGGDDAGLQRAVDTQLEKLGLTDRVTKLSQAATPFAAARIVAFLGAPRISASGILMASAVRDLEAVVAQPTGGTVTPPVVERPTDVRPGSPVVGRPGTERPGVDRVRDARLAFARAAAVRRPTGEQQLLTEADVVDVASDYGDPRLGDGLDRLAAARKEPLKPDAEVWLGDTGQALLLDRVARDLSADGIEKFNDRVGEIVAARRAEELERFLATDA
jgi:hypothetical protein